MSADHDWNTTLEYENDNNHVYDDDNNYNDDDDNESAYSLDYEFPGHRFANTRKTIDDDQEASDLSDTEEQAEDTPRFDMWDDDPYSDFTWESNEMQLTRFMKRKLKQALSSNFSKFSFWKKEKGWPRQLPYSSSSTNHEQSANAICLVQSNYGLSEQLFAVYRDRIIQCGKTPSEKSQHTISRSSSNAAPAGDSAGITLERETTYLDRNRTPTKHISKFLSSNQSISLSKIYPGKNPIDKLERASFGQQEYINQFKCYTKFIKREDFLLPEQSYMALDFDPQCLAQKYGYMAIGGVEGEFELYCCIDPSNPVKIWGTKFKGKDNVMLMTNAIQLVRWQNTSGEYNHMLISCMNEAGLLFYHLPSHSQCNSSNREDIVKLHSHRRSFHGMPINDAKLSPDGTKLVCVGDDYIIFMIDVYHCATNGEISFDTPIEIVIPPKLLLCQSIPYSSQYVA